MKELLEAGVHFGHQVRRWNPKMKEYIFGERNGIYIIDLQKTQRMFRDAIQFVTNVIGEDRGKTVLFVGTKRQAQDAIREEAERSGQYYINQRWLGGLLTNFQTVQKSIKRLKDLEAMQTDGRYEKLTKKECIKLDRERESLNKNLCGIKSMTRIPDIIFIIDVRKEEIAVAEANRLGIPVVAVVDTNCSPDGIDYIIPGNDDALRAVRLFASRIADAVLEGQQMLTEGTDQTGGATESGTPEGQGEDAQHHVESSVRAPSDADPVAEPAAPVEKTPEVAPDMDLPSIGQSSEGGNDGAKDATVPALDTVAAPIESDSPAESATEQEESIEPVGIAS
jgi:small subunit ribosomal protein S2